MGGTTGRVRAHEALGEERDRVWRRALEVYPGWSAYERRVAPRRIPVMVLVPQGGQALNRTVSGGEGGR